MGTPTHPTNSRYERVRPLTQAIWPPVVADVRGVRRANRARPRAPGNCCCRSDAIEAPLARLSWRVRNTCYLRYVFVRVRGVAQA